MELNGALLMPVRTGGGGALLELTVGGLPAGARSELRVRVREKESKRCRRAERAISSRCRRQRRPCPRRLRTGGFSALVFWGGVQLSFLPL